MFHPCFRQSSPSSSAHLGLSCRVCSLPISLIPIFPASGSLSSILPSFGNSTNHVLSLSTLITNHLSFSIRIPIPMSLCQLYSSIHAPISPSSVHPIGLSIKFSRFHSHRSFRLFCVVDLSFSIPVALSSFILLRYISFIQPINSSANPSRHSTFQFLISPPIVTL